MILDAITSSPFNVFFTIVIGIGLVYLYYRKPSSSSSTFTSHGSYTSNYANNIISRSNIDGLGAGVINEELQRTIAQIERQERDMIRQEQDKAYQQSLKADREKRLKREEELKDQELKERAEKERLARQEELHKKLTKLRIDISQKLPKSPSEDEDSIVKLVFKLPDGTRVKQNFHTVDKVKHLYWFVFSLPNAPLQFRMTTNFPKRDLPGRPPLPEDFLDETTSNERDIVGPNCEHTLEEAGLAETQMLFVYDLEA